MSRKCSTGLIRTRPATQRTRYSRLRTARARKSGQKLPFRRRATYASPDSLGYMSALTDDQLELLQRARNGLPMWGGSVATERLRRDVELLFSVRLLEPNGARPYRLAAAGAAVVDKARRVGLMNPSSSEIMGDCDAAEVRHASQAPMRYESLRAYNFDVRVEEGRYKAADVPVAAVTDCLGIHR